MNKMNEAYVNTKNKLLHGKLVEIKDEAHLNSNNAKSRREETKSLKAEAKRQEKMEGKKEAFVKKIEASEIKEDKLKKENNEESQTAPILIPNVNEYLNKHPKSNSIDYSKLISNFIEDDDFRSDNLNDSDIQLRLNDNYIDTELIDDVKQSMSSILPLKKRRLAIKETTEYLNTEDKKESVEISYPATAMLSIAHIEELVSSKNRFKTPAERKEVSEASLSVMPHEHEHIYKHYHQTGEKYE